MSYHVGKKNLSKQNVPTYVEKKIKLENIHSVWKKFQKSINVGPFNKAVGIGPEKNPKINKRSLRLFRSLEYINANLCTSFTEVLNNFGRSDDDMA